MHDSRQRGQRPLELCGGNDTVTPSSTLICCSSTAQGELTLTLSRRYRKIAVFMLAFSGSLKYEHIYEYLCLLFIYFIMDHSLVTTKGLA